jgi:hypothetical protein
MSALPPLQAEAERLARAVRPGASGHRRMGRDDGFWQFRHYQRGEPATMIDWRQSARGNKLYVRERENETNPVVYLWTDHADSMHAKSASGLPSKSERAQLLLLALSHVLLRDSVNVAWLDQPRITVQSMAELDALSGRFHPLTHHESGIPPLAPLARSSRLVIGSDFSANLDRWCDYIVACSSSDKRGVILHIVNPAEMESTAFAKTNARLVQFAKNIGWQYLSHITDKPPHTTLSLLHDLLAGELG